MQIRRNFESTLELDGRRQDGEIGEQGLWLLWLVSGALMAGGGAFARFGPDGETIWIGAAVFAFGTAIFGFGLYRLARREALSIDRVGRVLVYRTRVWPGPARRGFEASFEAVKEVRLRHELESPGAPGVPRSPTTCGRRACWCARARSSASSARPTKRTSVASRRPWRACSGPRSANE